VNIDKEVERIRETTTSFLEEGERPKPQFIFFKEEKFLGTLISRDIQPSATDRRMAITEACMLIPYLGANQLLMVFDMSIHEEAPDQIEEDAIVILFATRQGASGAVLPYSWCEDGTWGGWYDDSELTQEEIDAQFEEFNFTVLDPIIAGTIAHFMQFDRKIEYARCFIDTLTTLGHMVTLEYNSDDEIEHSEEGVVVPI